MTPDTPTGWLPELRLVLMGIGDGRTIVVRAAKYGEHGE